MAEMADISTGFCDPTTERDLLRKTLEAENACKATIERARRVVAEQRAELEAQILSQEEELSSVKESALTLQDSLASVQREGSGEDARRLVDVWPELEAASDAADKAHADLLQARRQRLEEAEEDEQRLEMQKSIYQMYAASTGIHWDFNAEQVEGYVALGTARHFKQPLPSDVDAQVAGADKLWAEIEASLGMPGKSVERPPWEAVPGGA
mmetsp:Transcript_110285/g.172435  ORF Transcript_110285/g.172435 Transcript_110285/m.172435 type:complete len:211 (+) Transcript_110285:79-711(+)|eukprot:CAMPEP_0169111700 /NCGR_PEP_ID=MMETSP1015-20121227/27218_1 /TAXON_ID=342587 /ORGANISM="Karlodinium micrum, Strain CCMP2283" /LENGTH=210 /DNA_ID=CAMNT_0009173641 /DNA_START=79 /DNA_END=711 /DNA_ORIENTATION=-